MNKTSLTRALFVAGALAVAGGMAQADVITYPDGTRVELSESSIDTSTHQHVQLAFKLRPLSWLKLWPVRHHAAPIRVGPFVNLHRMLSGFHDSLFGSAINFS